MKMTSLVLLFVVLLSACSTTYNPLNDYREIKPATIMDTPTYTPAENLPYSPEQITRGEYLVALLGCASCHTDGALVGAPDHQRHLAGSGTGIAYSNPLNNQNPGIVYPPNLTPDSETGIGNVPDQAIIQQITIGINPQGGHTLPVMPWPAYTKLSGDDVNSIVAYLRSLPSVYHRVPANVSPGQKATAPFVHFGVYQSRQ